MLILFYFRLTADGSSHFVVVRAENPSTNSTLPTSYGANGQRLKVLINKVLSHITFVNYSKLGFFFLILTALSALGICMTQDAINNASNKYSSTSKEI